MVNPDDELPALPDAYGRSRVVLLAVDPFHLHAYWEVTPEDRRRATEELELGPADEPPIWALRFYDVTYLEFDGKNAHSSFDVPVELGAKNWYVELWSAEKCYFVELGPRSGEHFVAACRSAPVQVPRADPSPRYEPVWGAVEPGGSRLVPGASPPGAAAPLEPLPEAPGAPRDGDPISAPPEAVPSQPIAAGAHPTTASQPRARSSSVSLAPRGGSGSAGFGGPEG